MELTCLGLEVVVAIGVVIIVLEGGVGVSMGVVGVSVAVAVAVAVPVLGDLEPGLTVLIEVRLVVVVVGTGGKPDIHCSSVGHRDRDGCACSVWGFDADGQ